MPGLQAAPKLLAGWQVGALAPVSSMQVDWLGSAEPHCLLPAGQAVPLERNALHLPGDVVVSHHSPCLQVERVPKLALQSASRLPNAWQVSLPATPVV